MIRDIVLNKTMYQPVLFLVFLPKLQMLAAALDARLLTFDLSFGALSRYFHTF